MNPEFVVSFLLYVSGLGMAFQGLAFQRKPWHMRRHVLRPFDSHNRRLLPEGIPVSKFKVRPTQRRNSWGDYLGVQTPSIKHAIL